MENSSADQNSIPNLVDPDFSGGAIGGAGEIGTAPAVVSIPTSIFQIGDDRLFKMKKYLQLVWDFYCRSNDAGRPMDIEKIMSNCFSLFSVNQLRGSDIFWKEHASANLRELTDNLLREHYGNALTCIDLQNQDILNNFKTVDDIRNQCLHNCAHFRTQACIDNARNLLSVTDTSITDDKIFDQIVTVYLHSIYLIVSQCNNT